MNKGTRVGRLSSDTRGDMARFLREEDMLLIELHRRIENNLQIIASLLQLKLRHSREQRVDPAFRRTRERIKVADRSHHNPGLREGLL